jgi:hypothetical protein
MNVPGAEFGVRSVDEDGRGRHLGATVRELWPASAVAASFECVFGLCHGAFF